MARYDRLVAVRKYLNMPVFIIEMVPGRKDRRVALGSLGIKTKYKAAYKAKTCCQSGAMQEHAHQI